MKKRERIFILLSICVFILAACSNAPGYAARIETEESISTNMEKNTSLYCEESIYAGNYRFVTPGPDGYYVKRLGWENSYLSYIDNQSMEEIYVCGKPECVHVDEKGDILETCDASLGDTIPACLLYHEGYVYYLEYNTPNTYDVTLARVSQDGSVHERLMTVGQVPNRVGIFDYLIIDDILYLVNNGGPLTYHDQEITTDMEKIDLNTGESSIVYSATGQYCQMQWLKHVDQYIYFLQTGKTEDYYGYASHLLRYNMQTGETEPIIEENIGGYTIVGRDEIYYDVMLDGVYSYNVTTGEKRLIRKCDEQTRNVYVSYDGTYIYLDNASTVAYGDILGEEDKEDLKALIYVCTLDGELVNIIEKDAEPNSWMGIEMFNEDGVIGSDILDVFYIPREDIVKEDAEWRTVQRYGQ